MSRQSFSNLFIDLIQLLILIVAVQTVLVNQIRYRRLERPGLNTQQACQKRLILLDSAQQNATNRLALLIFLNYLKYGLCVLFPDLLGDKGRVSQHKVKIIVVLLRNGLRLVEIILEEVGVVLTEFFVELS